MPTTTATPRLPQRKVTGYTTDGKRIFEGEEQKKTPALPKQILNSSSASAESLQPRSAQKGAPLNTSALQRVIDLTEGRTVKSAKPKAATGSSAKKNMDQYYSPMVGNLNTSSSSASAAAPTNVQGSHGANAPTTTDSGAETTNTKSNPALAARIASGSYANDKNHYRRAREALIKAAREYNSYQQSLRSGADMVTVSNAEKKNESSGSEMVTVSKSSSGEREDVKDREVESKGANNFDFLSVGSHQAAAPGSNGGALLHRPAKHRHLSPQLPASILKGVTVDLTSQNTPTLIQSHQSGKDAAAGSKSSLPSVPSWNMSK